ncbi:M28 family metallopeptidase [Clostridium uliginosum]|uniref:Peptidase family M28 n=1 Tax=Clostridium uliginosum TaxID=119641 RepID=A0A1I1I7I6_9CLOT|nr:M28 family metallopeptidase [Clostridium uliginosum]SFC32389.1 Peptidase family M28 [Clostridium uliginosum]
MKKFIYYTSLIVLFVCLVASVFFQTTYYHFDSAKVNDNIKVISSNEYEGRLTGSYGNEKASYFIESCFKNNKLSPFNNSYRESFEVTTPVKNDNAPTIKIINNNNNNVLHEYKYGIDFKEDMLNFNESSVAFTKEDTIDIFPSSLVIKHGGKNYLFYVSFDKNFSFRSSFNANSPYEFSVAITTEVYNGLLDSLRNNNIVNISIPYSKNQNTTSNIIGVIEGSSKILPPLVVTAHFDHIGMDYLNNYYNGALDNASGTAFILELSKSFSSLVKPKRNIIFVALTGEEFGLLGSEQFATEYNDIIKDSKVINFDMIGAPNTPISIIAGARYKDSADKNVELINSFEKICNEKNIDHKISFENSSDHASFANKGIDSVTLCHSDVSKIHTPNDKIDYIDISAIDQVYSIVKEEICDYAYDDFKLFLYNPYLVISLFVLFILLLCAPSFKKKIKVYINKKNKPLDWAHEKK